VGVSDGVGVGVGVGVGDGVGAAPCVGVTAIPNGPETTGIGLPGVLVATAIGVTELLERCRAYFSPKRNLHARSFAALRDHFVLIVGAWDVPVVLQTDFNGVAT